MVTYRVERYLKDVILRYAGINNYHNIIRSKKALRPVLQKTKRINHHNEPHPYSVVLVLMLVHLHLLRHQHQLQLQLQLHLQASRLCNATAGSLAGAYLPFLPV